MAVHGSRSRIASIVLFLLGWAGAGVAGGMARADASAEQVQSTSANFDCSTATDVPEFECQALVNLYNATGGPQWDHSFLWLSSRSVCEWAGVTCGFFGGVRVVELNLHDNNLSGPIPGEELGTLTELLFLRLSQNNLTGSMPSQLGRLQRLQTLVLDRNQLTGSIPDSLADLENLTSFQAVNNALTGRIPEALMGFCAGCPFNGSYGRLNLVGNDLEGELPADIGRTEISTLDFRNNPRLTGPIPASYTQLGQVGFFGYLGTDICTPADAEIRTWLNDIQSVLGSGLECVEGFSISGHVLHAMTGGPFLESVTVIADGGAHSAQTDAQGFYELAGLPAGTYVVAPEDPVLEFVPASREVTVGPDAERIDFVGRLPGSTVSGRLTDETGNPIVGVILETTPPVVDGFTDEDGRYVIDGLEPGRYEIEPISAAYLYEPMSRSFTVPPDATEIDFIATPLSFEPAVSALGPGWDLDGSTLDPDPDLSSLLEIGNSLRYSCSAESGSGACTLSGARMAFEAVEAERRCELLNLTPLPPSQDASAGYESTLEVAALPLPDVCDSRGIAAAPLQGAAPTTLSLAAGEEGFVYRVTPAGLRLNLDSDLATVAATGPNNLSVRYRGVAGETTVTAYSGALDVMPTNPARPPFVLEQGERATITADEVVTSVVCVGDCAGDGEVTVDELVFGVNIAGGVASVGWCPDFDSDGSGEITVDELVTSVRNGLSGCP